MEELVASLRVALGNTYVMYFKTHSFHWNVEGIMFPEYHAFLESIYTDVYGAVDPLAENLRKLDAYAPISLDEIVKHSTVVEETSRVVLIRDMLTALEVANQETIDSLNKVFDLATKLKKQGLANFVADRLDQHEKHGWMFRASIKRVEE